MPIQWKIGLIWWIRCLIWKSQAGAKIRCWQLMIPRTTWAKCYTSNSFSKGHKILLAKIIIKISYKMIWFNCTLIKNKFVHFALLAVVRLMQSSCRRQRRYKLQESCIPSNLLKKFKSGGNNFQLTFNK